MKNASQSFASVEDYNNKHFRENCNVNNHNFGSVAETSNECIISISIHLNMPEKWSQLPIIELLIPYLKLQTYIVRPSKQVVPHQNAVSNHLTIFHMHTYHSYTQSNGHILNLIPVMTSDSHSHIISHLQRIIFEAVVPSSFPIRLPDLSFSDGHLYNPPDGRKPMVPNANDSWYTCYLSAIHCLPYRNIISIANVLQGYAARETLKWMLANMSRSSHMFYFHIQLICLTLWFLCLCYVK